MKQGLGKGIHTGRMSYPGISVCLLYLLAASLMMTKPTFSRFVSEGDEQDGAAAAAAVLAAVGEGVTEIEVNCADGAESGSYEFTVTNARGSQVSEVAVSYDIYVDLTAELPEGVSMTLDNREPNDINGLEYRFSGAGTFEAGEEKTHEHILKFQIDSPNTITARFETAVEVTVMAEQID